MAKTLNELKNQNDTPVLSYGKYVVVEDNNGTHAKYDVRFLDGGLYYFIGSGMVKNNAQQVAQGLNKHDPNGTAITRY